MSEEVTTNKILPGNVGEKDHFKGWTLHRNAILICLVYKIEKSQVEFLRPALKVTFLIRQLLRLCCWTSQVNNICGTSVRGTRTSSTEHQRNEDNSCTRIRSNGSCNDHRTDGSTEVFSSSHHSCKKINCNKVVCPHREFFYLERFRCRH
jgi:hypothetical protein